MQIKAAKVQPLIVLSLTIALLGGCDSKGDQQSSRGNQNAAHDGQPASLWRLENNTTVVAVPDQDKDREMLAAMAQARATAEEARKKWTADDVAHRDRWAIKWAAPTADDRTEHVWVQPVNWSAFRVEGVLTSEPINELAVGKKRGDMVSFPIEELSDWVHQIDDPNATTDKRDLHEGGFTMKVLEKRFGAPKP